MIEEEQTDPLEITKDPQIAKAAQVELSKVDVLVCGECHEVFHFVQHFQEHRLQNKCTKESILKESCQNESKSQLWGFMLWKNAKFKNSRDEESPPSSWNVYQLWCNLDQSQKDAWISAGKSLQSIQSIATVKLQAQSKPVGKLQKTKMSAMFKKRGDEDLEEGEISQRKSSESVDESKVDSEHDPLADTETDLDTEEELEKERIMKDKCENGNIKKNILKPVQLGSDVTILPSNKKVIVKKAIRTNVDDKKTEYVVEKIVSKRYNPGKKTHEYFIKWENFDDDQNTWEPLHHLESCRALVEEFDKNLQKLKAQKLTKTPIVQRRVYKKSIPDKSQELVLTSVGRPQRTSKQKAVNQVKVWCGNISDADESSGKRAFSDSDSDSFEKKFKLEPESSESEDERPTVTVKRILKTPMNGVGRKQPLPENILVPDAQGIVRINQKQLPALSSGVYVMSKTAGIIKLDSNTSKIAASGGHAVIKVAPKIGQTSIKVVRREPTNGSKPNTAATVAKPKLLPLKPIGAKVIAHRKGVVSAVLRKEEPPLIEPRVVDEDDSDGLEELPFPTDLPLPEPDSPPGEFTLCPLTGKILGQDEPEEETTGSGSSTTVIKAEPTSDVVNSSIENASLDNLVKLTAADILNESPHIQSESDDKEVSKRTDVNRTTALEPMETESISENKTPKFPKEAETQSIEAALSAMEAEESPNPTATSPSGTSSILSTALSNANIEPATSSGNQRKVSNTSEVIRQKTAMNRSIINRTIIPKPAPQAIITRITPSSGSKHRQVINRPKLGGPPPTSFRKTVRQTYSNKSNSSVVRKIGSTNVYQTAATKSTVDKAPVASVTTTESLVETLSGTGTASIINMPLLSDAESASTVTNVANIEAIPDPTSAAETHDNANSEVNTISLNDADTPLLITGEDGTIYQVAGQSEDGETILISQGADGQQQCLLVASDSTSDLTVPTSTSAPVPSEVHEQMEEPLTLNAEPENDSTEDSQVVAQIVSAHPPSPGGTRKVVLMLPDGNLMMTEVTAEQYAALELDK